MIFTSYLRAGVDRKTKTTYYTPCQCQNGKQKQCVGIYERNYLVHDFLVYIFVFCLVLVCPVRLSLENG